VIVFNEENNLPIIQPFSDELLTTDMIWHAERNRSASAKCPNQ
jgi:hypothetical protein